MVKIIIKKVCMIALIVSIAAPISAMDSSDDSSWFTWSNAATVLAGIGLGYWAYSAWNAKPEVRKKVSATGRKVQATATYVPDHEPIFQPLSDAEVNPLFLSKEVVEFGKLSLDDQKRALLALITAYPEIPVVIYEKYQEKTDEQLSEEVHHAIEMQVQAEDLIEQFVQIIEQRTRSHGLDSAVNKMFSAQTQEARQREALKIKALLGV